MLLDARLSGVRWLTGAIRTTPVRADLEGTRRLTGLSLTSTRPVRADLRGMRRPTGPALITLLHADLRGMRGLLTGLGVISPCWAGLGGG